MNEKPTNEIINGRLRKHTEKETENTNLNQIQITEFSDELKIMRNENNILRERITNFEENLYKQTTQNNNHLIRINRLEKNLYKKSDKMKKVREEMQRHTKYIETLENDLNEQSDMNFERIYKLEKEIYELRTSYAFRICCTVLEAIRKPGKNTLMLPLKFIAYIFEYIFVRKHIIR